MERIITNLNHQLDRLRRNPFADFKKPIGRDELQNAADASQLCLWLEVAQRYGCLNIRVNVKRCEDLLAMAKAKGIEPKTHLTK